jgi:UDP-glucuronate decarboxylase
MKILVTGGAGFLGSHLCEKLLELKHEVICVDNFYTGSSQNITHLEDYDNFEVIRHDITFPLYLEVEGVFNLACPASPIQYQKNPVQTFKTNVHGAINMLGLAKRTGARFLQASTSEVYMTRARERLRPLRLITIDNTELTLELQEFSIPMVQE